MQDVCISLWNETSFAAEHTDVMVKVTDICSTDPTDASYCATPENIMIDRIKAYQLYNWTRRGQHENDALKQRSQYPHRVWWFFSKCFQDGLPGKGYNHSQNWFANPPLPNNWEKFAIPASVQQQVNNMRTSSRADLPQYEMRGWLTTEEKRNKARFDILYDWEKTKDQKPEWCPVAGGGINYGKPPGPCSK